MYLTYIPPNSTNNLGRLLSEDFELYYKDNVEPVNTFHPKYNRLRCALRKGQLASLDDVWEGTEAIRSLLI